MGDLGRRGTNFRDLEAKANTFREMRTLFAGRRGDQCIIFRDLGSTDPLSRNFANLDLKFYFYILNNVSGILLSNENYFVVIDLLKERYGDSQTVINSNYVELINLRPAPNNPRGLRSLYDQIEKHLRSLQALEQDINQDVFISMITSNSPKRF